MRKWIITAVLAALAVAGCSSASSAQSYGTWMDHGGRAQTNKLITDMDKAEKASSPAAMRAAGRQLVADAQKPAANLPPGPPAAPYQRAMADFETAGSSLVSGNTNAALKAVNQASTDMGDAIKAHRAG